jgi:hypothetical protein
MSCMIVLRYAFTASESVSTRNPSATGMLQAISTQLRPSTWTAQMRQLPATDSSGCQQKYGMSNPCASAACMTVWSPLVCTDCPFMKISGIPGSRCIASAGVR